LFEAPIGFWNERLNHPWFNKLPDSPLMFLQVSPGDLQLLGVQLRGSQYILDSPVKVEYAAYISNGLNQPNSPPGYTDVANLEALGNTFDAVNNNKLYGGRLGLWYPAVGLTAGVSGLLNGSYVPGFNDNLKLYQFDAGYRHGGLDVRFEYAHVDQQAASFIGNNIARQGLFAQIAYRPIDLPNGFLQKTEAVFRYSRVRFKGIDPAQLDYSAFGTTVDAPVDRDQYTVGLNYYFYASLVLKLAYEFNREAGSQSFKDDAFLAQLAWGF
jgi:hypothetical protein